MGQGPGGSKLLIAALVRLKDLFLFLYPTCITAALQLYGNLGNGPWGMAGSQSELAAIELHPKPSQLLPVKRRVYILDAALPPSSLAIPH